MKRTLLVLAIAAALAALSAQLCAASAAIRPTVVAGAQFRNCKALNSRYPHGVGKYGARDHTSGDPVTNFKRSNRLYLLNRGLDRDKDGIACEKK